MHKHSYRVLVLCTGNSCRSQMAEGYARTFGGEFLHVQSAGIEAHGKNPRAIAVMAEDGVDISEQDSTKLTMDMLHGVDLLVTVCGHADEQCPALPKRGAHKIHWPLSDPARARGTEQQIMETFRATRDEIKHRTATLVEALRRHPPGSVEETLQRLQAPSPALAG